MKITLKQSHLRRSTRFGQESDPQVKTQSSSVSLLQQVNPGSDPPTVNLVEQGHGSETGPTEAITTYAGNARSGKVGREERRRRFLPPSTGAITEMIPLTNKALITDPRNGGKGEQAQELSPRERRLERARAWRAANRERLRQYQLAWRAANPDRVAMHRENEYQARYTKRRRLRLRREAQRRRRELQRQAANKRWKQH
jgi:hypothetical protein